jgi:predicted transcriptional regulator of viral defense system
LVVSNKNRQSTYKAPQLAAREIEVLSRLERERRSRITLNELADSFGRTQAYEIVRSLVGKRVLSRVGRATYLAHPFRTLGRPWSPSAPVAAAQLLADEPYYLGGFWAWSHHRLTDQVHGSQVDAFVTRWRPARIIANARIVFHRIAPAKLRFGIVEATIENVPVRISDLERTLLDALDYPSLLGPLSDSIERVIRALDKAKTARLVSHAVGGSRTSTCQRIGLLLERRGASATALRPLRKRIRESSSLLSLWPDRARSGRVHPVWRVVENDHARRS